MSDDHDRVSEDLAAYALGALDADDRARVEAHLDACDECPRLLGENRAVVDLIPLSLPVEAPPPRARAALLARVRDGRAVVADTRPAPSTERSFERHPSRLARILGPLRWAAVAAVVALGVLFWSIQQGPVPHPSVLTELQAHLPGGQVLALAGTGSPAANARLYIVDNGQRAELAVAGLPPLPADRTYQLWFARPGQPTITGGPFRVGPDGRALAAVIIPAPLQQVSQIAITEEPAPRSPAPTGPHLLDWFPN